MRVTVVWATAEVQDVVTLDVPPGTVVADAVARSGLLAHYRLDPGRLRYAVFGRNVDAQARLADHDRVELTCPLAADPKELRQRRARAAPLVRSSPRNARRRKA